MRRRNPKMSELVVSALKDTRDVKGLKTKEIQKYILSRYNATDSTIKRQLPTTLKRGVEYGILKKTRQGYLLNDAQTNPAINPGNPEDACKSKKKKKSKRKKMSRRCGMMKKKPKKKKAKRAACPKKKSMKKKASKKKSCNVCLNREHEHVCVDPNYINSFMEESAGEEGDDGNNYVEEKPVSQRAAKSRSRSRSKPRSRSQSRSQPRSHYSGNSELAEQDDDAQEDEIHEDDRQDD